MKPQHRLYGEQPDAASFARLMRAVEACARALTAARAAATCGTGISAPQRRVIEALNARGPQSVPVLASALDVTRQAVQPFVDGLAHDGHVELLPNVAHRRSKLVRLTEAGRAVLGEIHAREDALDARMAPRFRAADVAMARQTVENLVFAYSGIQAWDYPRMRSGWYAPPSSPSPSPPAALGCAIPRCGEQTSCGTPKSPPSGDPIEQNDG